MKTLLSLVAVSLFVGLIGASADVQAQPYLNFGMGGDFSMSGYSHRDPRLLIQLEAGGQYAALPVSFSTGQDIFIIGVKPRIQYWISPAADTNLQFAPGIAPIFNYWNYDKGGVKVEVYEVGVQPSLQARYLFGQHFNVTVMPIGVDFDFWRHATASGLASGSASSTKLGVIYQASVSAGYNF